MNLIETDMKKSLLTAVFALASLGGVAYAQSNDNISVNTDKYKVETNRFWNNWFIDANGGVQVYFGDAEIGRASCRERV